MDNSKDLKIKASLLYTLKGHKSAVYALAPFKGHQFLSAGGDGWIAVWNHEHSEDGKLLAQTSSNLFSLQTANGGDVIMAGDINGDLHVVSGKGADPRRIEYHKKGLFGLYELKDCFLSLAGDGMMTKWSKDAFQKMESFQLSHHRIRGFALLPQSNRIAIGSSDRNIYIIDLETFSIQQVIKFAHENSVFTLAASKDEKFLLSGGRDAILKVWHIGEEISHHRDIPAHLFTINAIKYAPDQKIFATASRDKTIKIWDAKEFKLLKVLESIRDQAHINSVNDLLWLSENRLISCSDDRSIKVWDIAYC